MKLKIAHKLTLAFGILLIAMLVNTFIIRTQVEKTREINRKYKEIYEPSASNIEDLFYTINNSKLLIKNWVHIDKIEGTPDKIALENLHTKDYPDLKNKISKLVPFWSKENQQLYQETTFAIDTLFEMHKNIMSALNNLKAYDDPMIIFEITVQVEPDGEVILQTDRILGKLSSILESQKKLVDESNNQVVSTFSKLSQIIIILTLAIIIGIILIGYFTTSSIVKPMVYIKNRALDMAKGILPDKRVKESEDEVGQMAKAINILADAFKETSEFALKVGQGNFEAEYSALSDKDILGNSLLIMRKDLKEATDQLKRNEEILEQKVIERTAEVVKQKEIIEDKNKQLTAGINYAKRIQEAMLPKIGNLKTGFPDSFVLLRPRDIVSGDFYWFRSITDSIFFIAAVDCTGHGVPGGFMSMLGMSLLNEITRRHEIDTADEVLNELRSQVKNSLSQTGKDNEQKDGMDLAFCIIDKENNTLQYAGAYNPLILIRKNGDGKAETIEFKADKMPIGIYSGEEKSFKTQTHQLQKGDTLYMSSDGFIDQFGGPKGRKFLLSGFKDLLPEIYDFPLDQQRELLNQTIEKWMAFPQKDGNPHKQLDDILVIGIRV